VPGLVLGTVGYISPEQVRARCGSPVGRAVGAILYELLSGRRAFEGVTTADTLTVILVTKV
jgi:serine/threonine protein kinase